MNRAHIVVVFSVLVMFSLSHVISSHVAKDCGAHKPTNPSVLYFVFPCLVLVLYATIDHFV